jgi:hypothetical protein
MSVFDSHAETHHVRNSLLALGLCAVVAAGMFAALGAGAPLTAALRDSFGSPEPSPSVTPAETTFPQPRDVEWNGVVVGILAGGGGIAVRTVATGEMFQAYFKEGQTSSVSEHQPVLIRGRWTGISCAYRETVFKGQCTPTVDIDALEILPITFE